MREPDVWRGVAPVNRAPQLPGQPSNPHANHLHVTPNGGRHWATPEPARQTRRHQLRALSPRWILWVWILVVIAFLGGVVALAWR